MIIGVPKEIKTNENRVALTPAGALEFAKRGHTIFVETTAGVGSGFDDNDYIEAGAKILKTADEIWAVAEMIMKVKEPIAEEYGRCRKDQLIFHLFPLCVEPGTDARHAQERGCVLGL
jgi:alanine dehydrogenase